MNQVLQSDQESDQESTEVEKSRFTFKDWYAKNKERLAAERKAKYDNDPEYKLKVKQQAKQYRAKQPTRPRKKTDKMTIQQLCEAANCSIHTFKKYQQLKWVPTLVKGKSLTEQHVIVLAALVAKAKETLYVRKNRMVILQPYIDNLQAIW